MISREFEVRISNNHYILKGIYEYYNRFFIFEKSGRNEISQYSQQQLDSFATLARKTFWKCPQTIDGPEAIFCSPVRSFHYMVTQWLECQFSSFANYLFRYIFCQMPASSFLYFEPFFEMYRCSLPSSALKYGRLYRTYTHTHIRFLLIEILIIGYIQTYIRRMANGHSIALPPPRRGFAGGRGGGGPNPPAGR